MYTQLSSMEPDVLNGTSSMTGAALRLLANRRSQNSILMNSACKLKEDGGPFFLRERHTLCAHTSILIE